MNANDSGMMLDDLEGLDSPERARKLMTILRNIVFQCESTGSITTDDIYQHIKIGSQ